MPAILPQSWYVYYDGTNMADVLAMLNQFYTEFIDMWRVVHIDPGTGLPVIKRGFYEEYPLPAGRYVVRQGNGSFAGIMTATEFNYRYAGTVDSFLSTPTTFTATGMGVAGSTVAAGVTVNVDVQVVPPLPAVGSPMILSKIVGTTGVNLGSVSLASTPTVLSAFVPTGVVSGVVVPAHSVIRNRVRNSGLSLLSMVQVYTTVYVI